MALYGTNGQFGGSVYQNPQMRTGMAPNPWDYFSQIFGGLGTPGKNPWSDQYNKYMGGVGNVNAQQINAAQLGTNPMDVINSAKPLIAQQQAEQFAKAGARFGAQGMLASTPYAGELGRQASNSSNQLANLYYNTLGGAAENQANREMQAALANQQASLQAGLGNQSANLQAAELTQGGMNPWFGLAGQMAQLGLGKEQLTQQGQQFQQSQSQQASQFSQNLDQQAKQFAKQMGYNYDQLSQQDKQFFQQQAQQESQFGRNLGFQQWQANQQNQQNWFSQFMQWVQSGGDPQAFSQFGGQTITNNPWGRRGYGMTTKGAY